MPSTHWKELIDPGEGERFERYAQFLHQGQLRHRQTPPPRGLHVKPNLAVEGRLTVLDSLPDHARHGLFAKPASYPVWVRYSNGAPASQPDRKGDVRGIALKVMGVEGKKVIPGLEDKKTQDFLMIRSSALPFRTADEFMDAVQAMRKPLTALPKLVMRFGLGRTVRLARTLSASTKAPLPSVAASHYFTAAPLQCGPFAVRVSLAPRTTASGPTPEDLGAELASRLRSGPVTYDLRLQFFADEQRTPIEDASVDWLEADAPWLTVATLTIAQQDPTSARGQRIAAAVERMSFDPWHALVEHRPLGNVMRARNVAYRVSTAARQVSPEPDGTERFE